MAADHTHVMRSFCCPQADGLSSYHFLSRISLICCWNLIHVRCPDDEGQAVGDPLASLLLFWSPVGSRAGLVAAFCPVSRNLLWQGGDMQSGARGRYGWSG